MTIRQDTELRVIAGCIDALATLDDGQRARALSYLGDRFAAPPMVVRRNADGWRVELDGPMLHNDSSDEEERAPWPDALGEEPQVADETEADDG